MADDAHTPPADDMTPEPTQKLARDLMGAGTDPGPRAFGEPPTAAPTLPGHGAPRADAPTLPLKGDEWAWPNVPQRLGPYALVDELGHGGMGIVFRARHVKLESNCAVKVLIAGEHASPEAIARFRREAAAVAKMGKHPNIVTVHDLGQEGALSYYAMELVQGVSLRRKIREESYKPKEAAALVEKVARALDFAHKHGVIHRDMKPDNIVVRADGEPQVMDFGLARDLSSDAQLSATGQVMGTPAYMAPEQVRGEASKTDARTDVYALGAILYELLTGIPPHGGQDLGAIFSKILRGDIVPPRKLRPEVPRDVETVCLKCMELSPARRYQTAEALADDLARYVRGEPVLARPVGRISRFARRVQRHPLVSGLLAAVTVAVGALAWQFLGPAWVTVPMWPEHAHVQVNGRLLRASGLVWPAGDAVVTVQADEYETQTRNVTLMPGRRLRLAPFHLEMDHGFIAIASSPPGAEVSIDGKVIGRTPLPRAPIRNGSHSLALRLSDYEEWKDQVQVLAGADVNKGTLALTHEQGWLALDGTPRGMTVIVRDAATKAEVTRLSPPVEVPLATGNYILQGRLRDHFDRDSTIHVPRNEREHPSHVNVSLNRQRLWSFETGGEVSSSPALEDLNGDGCPDCVVGSDDKKVYALSGRDGSVLWAHETGDSVGSSPALADLNGDGCPDCIVGSDDKRVYALSGSDGSVLWAYETGGKVTSDPALADLDGDGCPDCVVGSYDKKVHALSGRDGSVLWAYETGDQVWSSPALADLNGDGCPDCVVGSNDKKVYALSGRDGSLLWTYETGGLVSSSRALADLNGDGCPDCVVGSDDKRVCAVSGRDGSALWAYETGNTVGSSPALADLNGDGCPDCVVGSFDKSLYALSGRDGSLLWTYETGGEVVSAPALADLDGDGCPDCVVGSRDHRVYALPGRTGEVLATWQHKRRMPTTIRPRFARLRHDRRWNDLERFTADAVKTATDPWARSVAWLHLGLARLRLGEAKGAIDAFAEARKLHLRAPDGAVFEWIAVHALAGLTPERRAEAHKVLLDALAFEPDIVLDAFVEVRDLLTSEAIVDLRSLLDDKSLDAKAQVVRAVLLTAFARESVSPDLLIAAERRISAKLVAAEGPATRWLGYLALLADDEEDTDRFRRAYATYLDLPRRPSSLDALLSEAAHRQPR